MKVPDLEPNDPLNTPVGDICEVYLMSLPDSMKIEDVIIKMNKSMYYIVMLSFIYHIIEVKDLLL